MTTVNREIVHPPPWELPRRRSTWVLVGFVVVWLLTGPVGVLTYLGAVGAWIVGSALLRRSGP